MMLLRQRSDVHNLNAGFPWQDLRRLLRPGRKNVLRVPFPPLLLEPGITDETGFHEHDMRWLKDPLQMRRILLQQGQDLPEPLQ